jgi:hypothetical protein
MASWLPASWRPQLSLLLPGDPGHYAGPRLPHAFTIVYMLPITARSLVHLLLPDGGAGSIATIDLSVTGGRNIIAIFGQWGAIQLLLAGLIWVLLLRYRGLLPLILAVLLLEPLLRAVSGYLKPLETLGVAPGAAFNMAVVPVLAIMLWLSLCPAQPPDAGKMDSPDGAVGKD